MKNPEQNEEAIFKAAIKYESLTEQSAYVRQACGSDAVLLARLGVLLRAHDDAGDFLETPALAPDVPLDESPMAEGPSRSSS